MRSKEEADQTRLEAQVSRGGEAGRGARLFGAVLRTFEKRIFLKFWNFKIIFFLQRQLYHYLLDGGCA